eukprot:7391978-Prymnesium_polylepis.3
MGTASSHQAHGRVTRAGATPPRTLRQTLQQSGALRRPPRLELGDARMLIIGSPCNGWLRICRLLHALQEAQVVEQADQLVGLLVAQAVATPVGGGEDAPQRWRWGPYREPPSHEGSGIVTPKGNDLGVCHTHVPQEVWCSRPGGPRPPVLHKLELRVDALADRGGGGLRQHQARKCLQLRHTPAVLVPPQVGRHHLGRVHDELPTEGSLPRAVQYQLAGHLGAELEDILVLGRRVLREIGGRALRRRVCVDGHLAHRPQLGKAAIVVFVLGSGELAHLQQNGDLLERLIQPLLHLLDARLLVVDELRIAHIAGSEEWVMGVHPALSMLLPHLLLVARVGRLDALPHLEPAGIDLARARGGSVEAAQQLADGHGDRHVRRDALPEATVGVVED